MTTGRPAIEPNIGARVGRRARYLARLLGDLWWMARVNRLWWLLPVVVLIVVVVAVGSATQTVLPYTVYTLF